MLILYPPRRFRCFSLITDGRKSWRPAATTIWKRVLDDTGAIVKNA
jgi:hypothetical protein